MTKTALQRETHVIDATGQILGRLATKVAILLRGKNKIGFVLHNDMGDFVTIKNPSKFIVTGNKMTQKKYYRHSGFPGNLKTQTLEDILKTNPNRIIFEAVRNMLPKNKLRNNWLKRLKFEDTNNA